ncbi:2Fe-2S iron-sulfur cluster binding domain-containing protein [Mycolicibacterium obuense]|uniref:2Fe-2S iron-sulfur cluster binding domain-containing protein n=1 Tax=Mycolicibacterium obuense TaxID=1807 RepID=A0A4R5X7V5_9MYCO|nr:2Fe-2S iron-sulfur cluster-binding protein [Mycolicibacterium obuense]TDL09774.1 2Fe-2S iron-sulfur cluster binding domain-containing protein [Mycolicibacterium obuense]
MSAAAHHVRLTVNGVRHEIDIDIRSTLLDVLRERLLLTGTKKGCDHGLCGACTVEVNGRRVLSCLTLAASIDDAGVDTVEGMADGQTPTALQQAFIDHDGFQCGYCTPGQLCSSRALLREFAAGDLSAASFEGSHDDVVSGPPRLTQEEIRERMAGNICRCGAYANIVAAISSVHENS